MLVRLFLVFAKIGLFAFGGGYAMIPFLERELVAHEAWLSHGQFLDMVVLSQVTPGPIFTSAGVIVGFRNAGVPGAVVATVAVVLPSLAIVGLLGWTVVRHGHLPWLQSVFTGLRPVVVALVAVAAVTLARSSVPEWRSAGVAVAVGLAVGCFRVHPIWAILGAGLLGIIFF